MRKSEAALAVADNIFGGSEVVEAVHQKLGTLVDSQVLVVGGERDAVVAAVLAFQHGGKQLEHVLRFTKIILD